ncbi:hypothetical protein FRC12_025098 [Ceratobasidium sp. 428]|nr:hypothetical protein FRC12_025098 [Ceratobasidium sp. 428]
MPEPYADTEINKEVDGPTNPLSGDKTESKEDKRRVIGSGHSTYDGVAPISVFRDQHASVLRINPRLLSPPRASTPTSDSTRADARASNDFTPWMDSKCVRGARDWQARIWAQDSVCVGYVRMDRVGGGNARSGLV